MKKYPLSTPSERTVGIIFSLVMLPVLVILLYAMRNNIAILLLVGIGIVLVEGALILYVLNVMKAACVHDPETNTLKILGLQERSIDLGKVATLRTLPVKSGQVESRSLAFLDAEGAVVAVVPTYFTSKCGILAEPMAQEMAAELGIAFESTVPVWQYDKEARKIHDAEVAQQEKEEAKKDREARMAMRVAKMRKRMEESRQDH